MVHELLIDGQMLKFDPVTVEDRIAFINHQLVIFSPLRFCANAMVWILRYGSAVMTKNTHQMSNEIKNHELDLAKRGGGFLAGPSGRGVVEFSCAEVKGTRAL